MVDKNALVETLAQEIFAVSGTVSVDDSQEVRQAAWQTHRQFCRRMAARALRRAAEEIDKEADVQAAIAEVKTVADE